MRLSSFALSIGSVFVLVSGLTSACANSPEEAAAIPTDGTVDSGSKLPDNDDDEEIDSGVTQARDPEPKDSGTTAPKDAGKSDSGGNSGASQMCTGNPMLLGAQLAAMIAFNITPTPCDPNSGAGCGAGQCCFGGACLIGD